MGVTISSPHPSSIIIQLSVTFCFCLQAKSEEQVATEKQWLDAEKIWLMHRGGFAAARKDTTAKTEAGKLVVKLEQTGEILNVDEDDVEKVELRNKGERWVWVMLRWCFLF